MNGTTMVTHHFIQAVQGVKPMLKPMVVLMQNKHIVVNVIKAGYKLVSVDDEYFTTLNLLGDEK